MVKLAADLSETELLEEHLYRILMLRRWGWCIDGMAELEAYRSRGVSYHWLVT